MVNNQLYQTLLERLNHKGSVRLADVYQELVRIKGLRERQEIRLASFATPKPQASARVSLAARLLSNADKVIALVSGVTMGMRMIRRIGRLFR